MGIVRLENALANDTFLSSNYDSFYLPNIPADFWFLDSDSWPDGMTLAEFEAASIVEKQGYSHEVESDHQDWDQAVDGIQTLREALRRLQEPQ